MARRPSIPPEVKGLFAALGAHQQGDLNPLLLWHRVPRWRLRQSLERWCRDPELADATLECVVVSAYLAHAKGVSARDELAWMSGVAQRHRAKLARSRSRAEGLATVLGAGTPPSDSPRLPRLDRAEGSELAHARVLAAIALLPPPYCEAMTLRHLGGRSNSQVTRWLRSWNPISEPGARYILKEGRSMLEAAVLGCIPSTRWPRRFPGKSRWRTIPPPPPAGTMGESLVVM